MDAAIYRVEDNSLNGIPIDEIEQRLGKNPQLPNGMRGACWVCVPAKYFKTFDELTKHAQERHDYRKY